MKILIVRTFPDKLDLHSYNVQEIGLAKALVARGNQCDIVLYNGRESDHRESCTFQKNGKEYSFIIYWMKGFCCLKNGFMPSVRKILPEYDVIQVQEYDQIMSWQLYTRQLIPTVIYHGPYYHFYARGYNLKCRVFDTLFLPWRKYKDVRVLTKSEMAAEFIRKKGFEKIVAVGVGIDTDNFSWESCEKSVRPQLLYVGKIEERRNVYFLIEVFRKLRQDMPELQLVLVGNGERKYKSAFLNEVKKELDNGDIIYREKVQQKELPKIYRNAEVFLFTSKYEIFGMVLLEAMYFGLPVVSSMNGGASMLIEDDKNGYILENFDLETWAQKLEDILRDRDKRERMGQSAREKILRDFTWEQIAEKFETVYRQAVEEFERNRNGV